MEATGEESVVSGGKGVTNDDVGESAAGHTCSKLVFPSNETRQSMCLTDKVTGCGYIVSVSALGRSSSSVPGPRTARESCLGAPMES